MGRRLLTYLHTILFVLVAAGMSAPTAGEAESVAARNSGPVIVVRGPTASSWLALLRASGAEAHLGTALEVVVRRAGVVPAGARMTASDVSELAAVTRAGGRLVVADGRLITALGLRLPAPRNVRTLRMVGLDGLVRLAAAPVVVRPLQAAPRVTLERLAWSGSSTLLARARVGRGTAMLAAFDPFASGLSADSTLPLLGRMATVVLSAPPGPERDAVEVYLDPGHVQGSPEEIAARVDAASVVHVAGWNAGFVDPSLDYPYARLIDALHRRGIRVYAWLEPPFVGARLWTERAECREKTLSGADATDDWRTLVALEDERCFDLAWAEWSALLLRHAFDGVNVAELYWASTSVPGHPSALTRFGGDPRLRPAAWLDFRRDLLLELTARIVDRLRALPRPLDVVVTSIDDGLDPALARRIGSDLDLLAPLARRTGATLQIEDPYTTWTRGPSRYVALAARLERLMPPGRALVDINVVHRKYAYPTATMTGAELDLSIANAGRAAGRVALYSVGTLLPGDLKAAPAALAAAAVSEGDVLRGRWSLVVRSPRPALGRLVVDGRRWPSHDGRAIVPAGSHVVRWVAGREELPALRRLSAELTGEASNADSLTFSYSGATPARAVIDRAPMAMTIDGMTTALAALPAPDGGASLPLPAGRHTVRMTF